MIEETDENEMIAQAHQRGREETLELLVSVLRWMDKSGNSRRNGLRNRAITLLYLLSPDYSRFQQTDLLLRFRLRNKQLINREIQDFRETFQVNDSRLFTDDGRRSLAMAYAARNESDREHKPDTARNAAAA